MTSRPTCRVYLLGAFRVECENTGEREVSSLQARRVLAYLALHAERPVTRAKIVGVLFPEMPEERGRRALSQALWRLRTALNRPVVKGTHNDITLHPAIWSDVHTFRILAGQQDVQAWEESVLLYQGEFLPGVYDEWVLIARERLRETYLRVLRRLVQAHKQSGNYEQALHYARIHVREEPLWEEGHREIMQLYLILDRPAAALQQYETLRAFLEEELGVSPSPGVEALLQVIQDRLRTQRAWKSAPLFRAEQRIPFVGRHEERARLLEQVEHTLQGHGSLVFVEGRPGIGKSRLLREIVDGARWRGIAVGCGQATEDGGVYTPLRDAVERLLSPGTVSFLRRLPSPILEAAARVWPKLGTPAAQVEPQHIHRALAQVIHTLAQRQPTLLVLDDIHHADATIFDVLSHLADDLAHIPLCIIMTYRPMEVQARPRVWEGLMALDRVAAPSRVRLHPLTSEEQALLIAAALGTSVTDPLIPRLSAAVGDLPLHVLEMLRYLHRRGILQRTTDGQWVLTTPPDTPLPVPPTLTSPVQQRVQRLPAAVRDFLEVLSVFGERIPQEIVEDWSALYPATALSDLRRHGFLTWDEGVWRFSHALIQQAVYTRIPATRRPHLHRRVAERLTQLSNPPWEQIAHHWERAGQTAAAVQAYYRFAQEAAHVFAHDQVLKAWTAARTLLQGPDPLGYDLGHLAVQSLMVQGNTSEARRTLALLLWWARCLRDQRRLARGYLTGGELLIRMNKHRSARWFLRRARALYAALEASREQTATLTLLADVALTTGDLDQAAQYLDDALHIGAKVDASLFARIVARQAVVNERLGRPEEASRLYTLSIQKAREAQDKYVEGFVTNGLGLIALIERAHEKAWRVFRQALAVARSMNDVHNTAISILNMGVAASQAGEWEKAYALGQKALDLVEESRDWRTWILAQLLLSSVETMSGHFSQAAERLQRGMQKVQEIGFVRGQGSIEEAWGIWAREQGRFEDAIMWGQRALRTFQDHGLYGRVPVAAYALATSLLLARSYDSAREVLHLGVTYVHSAQMRAYLQAALAALWAFVEERERARKMLDGCVPQLEHISSDEYLPLGWYQVAQAAARVMPEYHVPAVRRAYMALQAQCHHVPAADQRSFLHRVLTHRLIVQEWQAFAPPTVERLRIPLPGEDGQSTIMVTWTVQAGEEDAVVEAHHGPVALRRHRLKRLLREAAQQGARATHRALAQALGVSVPTIRRDLRALRETAEDLPSAP